MTSKSELFLGVLGGIIILFFILAIMFIPYAMYSEFKVRDEWKKYASKHCKVVGYISSGYRSPSRTGYLCDDGITYYK